jgi:hypothetical protein
MSTENKKKCIITESNKDAVKNVEKNQVTKKCVKLFLDNYIDCSQYNSEKHCFGK